MIKEAILKVYRKENLSFEEAQAVMDEIMSGAATPVQMSAYLTALSMKGETIEEITGSAAGMRAHCVRLLHDVEALEIVGTGGDGANSFNISTTAAMVIAAAGRAGGQARQSGGVLQKRCGGCAGSARCEHSVAAGTQRRAAHRYQHLLPLRTELSRGDEICRADSP